MRNTHNAADSRLRCSEPRSRAIIVRMVYCMPQGTPPPPPPPPGRWWGFDQGRVKCILNPHSGTNEMVKQPHPCTRRDHSADWCRSMCPTPVTHLVVKIPTPGQSEAVKSPVVSGGGGGGGGGGLQLIGA